MERQIVNEKSMIEYGKTLAQTMHGGDIILLHGDLGAGKTTLTKGIAKYFGIEDVVSPTFTLMQVYHLGNQTYKNINTFVHIDTYRLEDEQQLQEIGVEDYLGEKNTVCIIEWPEKMQKLLENKKVINVYIEHSKDGGRCIEIKD